MKLIIAFFTITIFLAASSWAQQAPAENKQPDKVRLVEQAYLDYRSGRLAEAVDGYTKVIQTRGLASSERATAYLLRGEAKRDLGQLDDAVLDFTRAIKQSPNYAQAYFFRAKIYEQQGRLIDAWKDYSFAANWDPGREDYQNYLTLIKKKMSDQGWVLQESGDWTSPGDGAQGPEVPAETR